MIEVEGQRTASTVEVVGTRPSFAKEIEWAHAQLGALNLNHEDLPMDEVQQWINDIYRILLRWREELAEEFWPTGAPKVEKLGWRAVLGEIFSPRNAFPTICFWVALFMGLLLVYGIAQWLPQIMRKSGYNLGDSLLFLAVFSFTSAIGGIVLGQWADRFGVRLMVTLAYALGAVGIAALAFKGSIWLNYTMVAIAGFGTVSASLILTGYLADYLAPFVRSAGTGWALSFARIGALTGPLLGGYIASLNIGPQWNFYIFAVAAAIAAVATALIPKK